MMLTRSQAIRKLDSMIKQIGKLREDLSQFDVSQLNNSAGRWHITNLANLDRLSDELCRAESAFRFAANKLDDGGRTAK